MLRTTVMIGSIDSGRQSKVSCDAQIEQGKIIPMYIIEFKIQRLRFLTLCNQFLDVVTKR